MILIMLIQAFLQKWKVYYGRAFTTRVYNILFKSHCKTVVDNCRNYTMENLTENHLLMLTKYHFGQNVQIKYKQNGITSGWYLFNNNHSYCIGKDAFSAALWLISSSPHFIEPNSFTTPVFSWINLGYQEYLNNVIAHQLIDQNECSTKPDNNIRSSAEYLDEILTNFKQMGGNNSALLVLIWTLGMPLKWFIGYYPKLILIGEEHGIFKVDKNALLNRVPLQ